MRCNTPPQHFSDSHTIRALGPVCLRAAAGLRGLARCVSLAVASGSSGHLLASLLALEVGRLLADPSPLVREEDSDSRCPSGWLGTILMRILEEQKSLNTLQPSAWVTFAKLH